MTARFASCLVVFFVVGLESLPGHACPGMFLPPFKLDLGLTRSESGTRAANGSQLLVGLSRSTLDPRPIAWDVGLGYVRWSVDDDASTIAARSTTSSRPISDAEGVYVDFAARIQDFRHVRSWLGVRGELLDTDDGAAFGVAARLSTELWTGANARDGLFAFGSLAIGAYVETGWREGRDDDVKTFTVGITVRSPFVVVGGGPRRAPEPPQKTPADQVSKK